MKQPITSFIDKRNVVLHEDFTVRVVAGSQSYIFTVPKGFKTDGASIPRIFWGLFKPYEGDTLAGALVHDYLYSKRYMPRYLADWILYKLLVKYRAGRTKASVYFIFVRLFGGFTKHYRSYQHPYIGSMV